MGDLSKRLHRRLSGNSDRRPTRERSRVPGVPRPGDIRDVATLVNNGLDPLHAAYTYIQQMSSYFAEGVSQFPELKPYAKIVGDAENEYLPSGPPMSPLTGSYFTCWAFYDLRFGRDGDTIGECQIDASGIIGFNTDQSNALRKLSESRMGVYEHLGPDGSHVRLRELMTDDEFICHSGSGYRGRRGELWYVRLLPPLAPEMADYHIAFTTPYVLVGATKGDWMQFLKRILLKTRDGDDRQKLHCLFKYGADLNHWNEFVFKAYHHHQSDAIFLTGIPDLKATLPHA